MLLPSSIERTLPAPESQQALLVVSPDGRIQFATQRAARWLRGLPLSPRNRLPQALASWLEDGVSASLPSRFIVDRAGTELCFRQICRERSSICLLLEQKAETPAGKNALTQRQVEVLSWVARGKTNAEIAKILRLKTRTIGKYLERIFPKLGVENRTAAASFVLGTNRAT